MRLFLSTGCEERYWIFLFYWMGENERIRFSSAFRSVHSATCLRTRRGELDLI